MSLSHLQIQGSYIRDHHSIQWMTRERNENNSVHPGDIVFEYPDPSLVRGLMTAGKLLTVPCGPTNGTIGAERFFSLTPEEDRRPDMMDYSSDYSSHSSFQLRDFYSFPPASPDTRSLVSCRINIKYLNLRSKF